ncbi:MAG: nuclear transport factor 2 family protein [Bacteroidetes bacterium]|nr:nuclear transport factor 2 family protein [Bacteroidota bacterium]
MRHALATLLLLIAAGCSTPDAFTETDQQRVTAEVDSMLHAYLDAMREGGLEAEFAYLDSTDAFFWVPPGYDSWISFDSVAAVLRAMAPTLRSMDYRWQSLRIDPISDDRAIYTGTLSGAVTDTSGQVTNLSIIETGTVIRREDGWKLLNGQSAVLPVEESG